MDKFVKRYYHYEKDEHGNDIKVANMISQKNPEHSDALKIMCAINVCICNM